MTLLKDVRLLLIIGLAILCLLALRLCSSEYDTGTAGTTETDAETTAVANNGESGDQQNLVAGADASDEAPASDDTAKSDEAAEAEVVAESDEAAETESAEETEAAKESEATAEDANAEETATAEETAEAEGDSAAAESTENESDTAKDAEASESGSDEAAASDDESAASDSDSSAQTFEVVPSAIGDPTETSIEMIELNAPAGSGELIPDLQADIESVKDGMLKYNGKLDLIDTIIEKVKNPG